MVLVRNSGVSMIPYCSRFAFTLKKTSALALQLFDADISVTQVNPDLVETCQG